MRIERVRKSILATEGRIDSIYSCAVLPMRVSSLPNFGHSRHVDVYSRHVSDHSATEQTRRPCILEAPLLRYADSRRRARRGSWGVLAYRPLATPPIVRIWRESA